MGLYEEISEKLGIDRSHLFIGIPTGRGAKIRTISQANSLAYDFVDLGNV